MEWITDETLTKRPHVHIVNVFVSREGSNEWIIKRAFHHLGINSIFIFLNKENVGSTNNTPYAGLFCYVIALSKINKMFKQKTRIVKQDYINIIFLKHYSSFHHKNNTLILHFLFTSFLVYISGGF